MDILENIFGSNSKVKIIKLFLFNHESVYGVGEVADRAKVSRTVAKREIINLENASFLKPRSFSKEVKIQRDRKIVFGHKKAEGWMLDYKFPYLEAVYNFFSELSVFNPKDLENRLSKAVKVQLLIISGLFIKNADSRVDLLIVGDGVKEDTLETIIKNIESEIGREIKYAVFETSEFKYRLSVFDKLIRDILDYPHEKIVNKLGI